MADDKIHWNGPEPTRKKNGTIVFSDHPEFYPNLTPKEVLQSGSFGGSYFRDIESSVTGEKYKDMWKELPDDWIEGLNRNQYASDTYKASINKYKVDCGVKADKDDPFGLNYWESKGWIKAQDPYGWFHFYTRFYRGRRSPDDKRQISRWAKCAGDTGRWRNNLIGKILAKETTYDDEDVSPVVRQTLQHWAYRLTEEDFIKGRKRREGSAGKTSSASKKRPASPQKEGEESKKRKSGKGVMSKLLPDSSEE